MWGTGVVIRRNRTHFVRNRKDTSGILDAATFRIHNHGWFSERYRALMEVRRLLCLEFGKSWSKHVGRGPFHDGPGIGFHVWQVFIAADDGRPNRIRIQDYGTPTRESFDCHAAFRLDELHVQQLTWFTTDPEDDGGSGIVRVPVKSGTLLN